MIASDHNNHIEIRFKNYSCIWSGSEAVGEVEWLKRSERWDIICAHQLKRDKCMHHPKFSEGAALESGVCFSNSRKWRKWGNK